MAGSRNKSPLSGKAPEKKPQGKYQSRVRLFIFIEKHSSHRQHAKPALQDREDSSSHPLEKWALNVEDHG